MEKHHIEVMLPEEKVDARIREIGEQRICWKECTSDLHFKGKCIFYLRTGKKNYCTGNHGFHAVFQL